MGTRSVRTRKRITGITLAALAGLALAGPAVAHDGWRHRHRHHHRHWHPSPYAYVVPPPAWHGWGGVYVPLRPPVFYGQRRPYDHGYGGWGVPREYVGPGLYRCPSGARVSC